MKKAFIILLATHLLMACSHKQYHLPVSQVSTPQLNQEFTTNLGERMIMQAVGLYTDILKIKTLDVYGVYISGGQYCRIPNSNDFVSFNGRAIGKKNAFGGIVDFTSRLEFRETDNEVCVEGTFTLCFDDSEADFKLFKDQLCTSPTAFQQIIEYNGREGNILRFTYREFSRERIHSQYTTNFSMDLNKGDEITYKGAKLKIIEASNQSITYQVIKNFNDAAF